MRGDREPATPVPPVEVVNVCEFCCWFPDGPAGEPAVRRTSRLPGSLGARIRMKMHVGEEDNEIGGGQHAHHPHYAAYNKHGKSRNENYTLDT